MPRPTHLQCGKCGEMVPNNPPAIREHLEIHTRRRKQTASDSKKSTPDR